MPSNNGRPQNFSFRKQQHICPKCSFDNRPTAIYCEICFYSLNPAKSLRETIKQPPPIKSPPVQQRSSSVNHFTQELRQPSTISGLIFLFLALALWVNYFLNRQTQHLTAGDQNNSITLYDSMSEVKEVPSGLYSYGGALYFASLVANGMNDAMFQEHTDFSLRYTRPRNGDLSYSNGIEMLLDGELSFAFNGRPLLGREYSQAKLRDMTLQQVPIAIDGVVFFGNRDITVDGLNVKQARDIFTGKIVNWSQLGGKDLPIIPILLSTENIKILNINDPSVVPRKTEYVDNYTLAIRKAISTPGSIAFVSASLAKKQQLIKVFDLAAGNSSNYIDPFIAEGKPNLELFKNGKYPLTRRLFLVIRQDGTPDSLAGKSYAEMLLSLQGQKIVEQSGFVPLHGDR